MKNKKILVCGLIILILIVFLIVFKNKIQRIFYPKLHEEFVSMYSDEYGVDENLVFAVIKAESNFQEDAVSHKDALGLMQIMKETAEDVARKYNIEIDFNNSEREILNVQNNIKIGTKYLAVLLEKYKNIPKDDAIGILSSVGGFEFTCIVGVILGAAANNALVIIDGFNTSACALVAKTLVPQAMDYVMASHLSAEKAAKSSLENLGLEAYVDLGLCLGEASGGSIQMGMLDLAVHMYLAVTGGKA